ncbi:hypothetical protein B9479_008264 [Cryptococcus floricola]|uniref:Ubiquitin-like protease family profile domain-containing protein n=1 Tax=Cryptococcus floricola TaxID=2591691 RepID=A0A5D3AMG1_9TREE|nr:hypothetical protein B9479_008264 [Cryptococcus floricola]
MGGQDIKGCEGQRLLKLYSSQYIADLFHWNSRVGHCDWNNDGLPLPLLGKGTGWRQKVTVTVIPNKGLKENGNHWLTVVIFGPKRLVAIFDGAGGAWDAKTPRITAILQGLQDRQNYELEHKLVEKCENEGWQMPKSTEHLRDICLEWAVQKDSHSCGPLAVLVGCLVLRGIRPTREAVNHFHVDMTDTEKAHSFKNANLRNWVLQVLDACFDL